MDHPRFTTTGIFKGALLGGLVASVINVALYFVGRASGAGFIVETPNAPPGPIPFIMPAAITMIAAVIAAVLLVLLVKFVPTRAWSIFLIVAAVVFVLYAVLPVQMLEGDTMSILFLELMHIPSALGIVGGISRHRAR